MRLLIDLFVLSQYLLWLAFAGHLLLKATAEAQGSCLDCLFSWKVGSMI